MYISKLTRFAVLFLIILSQGAYSFDKLKPVKQPVARQHKIPVVYHPGYNISLLGGLETKIHPFDGSKYGKIATYLCYQFKLSEKSFHKPEKISDADLQRVHTPEYIKSLQDSRTVASVAEIPYLSWVPNWILQRKILNPMRLATQGTVDAVNLALEEGVAFNLSGGYHHARTDRQLGGLCFFADISLAINMVREKHPTCKTIVVVDLDAHRGNGLAQVRGDDQDTFIFDMYSEPNYPGSYDLQHARPTDTMIPVANGVSEAEYLTMLADKLANMIDRVKPDLVIYNAGTDIYAGDALGRMNVSAQGIITRDEHVFQVVRSRNIPLAMTLSGGYSKDSAAIVGRSIENLLRKYIKI